jgi:hypothetical protein
MCSMLIDRGGDSQNLSMMTIRVTDGSMGKHPDVTSNHPDFSIVEKPLNNPKSASS